MLVFILPFIYLFIYYIMDLAMEFVQGKKLTCVGCAMLMSAKYKHCFGFPFKNVITWLINNGLLKWWHHICHCHRHENYQDKMIFKGHK